ncbi:hypothetical protein [Nannocystis pusilla]|uniref:Uncharacterized protein n=1 Tax=Nannocystis pusilla TaxID=889268 RepID=A0ABS7TWI2_9BACT|nr:hypothetical protein [Nannocystis pusilla]MBZ5712510.1 hypothetical protein [Nannocystis pusilla]
MMSRGWLFVSVLFLSPACGETGGETATLGTTSTTTGATATTTPATTTTSTGVPTTSGTTEGTAAESPTTSTTEPATTMTGTSEPGTTGTTTTGTTTTTTGTTTTTTTTTTGEPGTTSTGGSSTTTGSGVEPPPPDMLAGCQTCDCCDPWWISWDEVPGATYYQVRWKCSINPEQVHDVGAVTMIADVCNDIDMCNGMCAFTVAYIRVEACNEDGCSAPVDIPTAGTPLTCGGGCCC